MTAKKSLLALLLMTMSFALVACGKGPAATLEDAMYAIAEGDQDTAIEIMPPRLRAAFGDDKLKQMLIEAKSGLDEKGGIDDIEVLEENVNDQKAEVKMKITYGNGTSDTETTKMIKIDDKWMISDEGMNK